MARRARTLLAALAAAALGCGQGLYDGRWTVEGGSAAPDAGPPDAAAPDDAGPPGDDGPPSPAPDGAPDTVAPPRACRTMDYAGGTLWFEEELRLVVAANALRTPTEVCVVRTSPAERRGPLGRAYEIRLSNGVSRFSEPPLVELRGVTAPAGVAFDHLSLAYLQRESASNAFWWIQIQDSRRTDAALATVAGKLVVMTEDRRGAIALVVTCGTCPASLDQRCYASACQ